MICIETEVFIIKECNAGKNGKKCRSFLEISKAILPDTISDCDIDRQLKMSRKTDKATATTFIVNQIINSAVSDSENSKKIKRIYILYSNHIFGTYDEYSKNILRYFIRMQRKNNDLFMLLSNNPIILLYGKYLGFSVKLKFLLAKGRKKYGKYS